MLENGWFIPAMVLILVGTEIYITTATNAPFAGIIGRRNIRCNW